MSRAAAFPKTLDDLASHPCLVLVLVRGRRAFDRWRFHRGDGVPIEIRVAAALLSTSGGVIHDGALAGEGIALKAEWNIADDLRAGCLVEGLAPFAVDAIRLYVVVAARDHLRTLVDFLRESLA